MSDSNDGRSISRRGLMSGLGGAAGGLASLASGGALSGDDGDLFGGNAALSQAYNVADTKLWVGPDSAKGTVSAESGRLYYASDTQVQYVGDSGSWVLQGIGSSSQPVPSVTTEQMDNVRYASNFNGANGREQIQAAIDDIPSGETGEVVIGPVGPDDVSGSSGSIGIGPWEQNAWLIDQHLSVPSYITLRLKSCYVFLQDGADDNLIRNSDFTNGNEDISIIADGNSVFDGNANNQTTFDNQTSDALKNIGLRFHKVDNLNLHNFKVRYTNAWAIKAEAGDEPDASQLEFDQGSSGRNRDGVHILGPSEDVNISDISGSTEDDTVAVNPSIEPGYAYQDGSGGPVYRVNIDNVASHSVANSVRIFTGDETILKDVNVNNISHIGNSAAKTAAVAVGSEVENGDNRKYVDVNISNVTSHQNPAVRIMEPCRSVNIDGVTTRNANAAIEVRPGLNSSLPNYQSKVNGLHITNLHLFETEYGVQFRRYTADNVKIRDVHYKSDGNTQLTALFDINNESGAMVRNLSIDGVTGFTNDGSANPVGTFIENAGDDMPNLQIRNVDMQQIDTFMDLTGSVDGRVENVEFDTVNTRYANLPSGIVFGENVPPIAIGSLTLTSGSTGVQSTTETAVTVHEGRRPRVVINGVDTATTPSADYAWRREEPDIAWDNTNGDIDVTVRANLVTDPGSNFDLRYEVLP